MAHRKYKNLWGVKEDIYYYWLQINHKVLVEHSPCIQRFFIIFLRWVLNKIIHEGLDIRSNLTEAKPISSFPWIVSNISELIFDETRFGTKSMTTYQYCIPESPDNISELKISRRRNTLNWGWIQRNTDLYHQMGVSYIILESISFSALPTRINENWCEYREISDLILTLNLLTKRNKLQPTTKAA